MEKMELPKEWVSIGYNELFTQVSTTNKKIKTKDMLDTGKYPVIDQSESFISGFYNDETKLVYIQQPVIVFGDHTRCIKWVDFNFVPGADGIQVLLPNKPLEPRYMFYALKTLTLPNKGYSRHFKFLKEKIISVASLNEQKEIVRTIESHLQLVDQIKSRLDALPKILEQFRQSVLASAVSGRLTEDWRERNHVLLSNWNDSKLLNFVEKPQYGSSTKSEKKGVIPVLRMGNIQNGKLDWTDLVFTSDESEIVKFNLKYNDLLFNRTNSPALVGKTAIYKGERPAIFAGYLIRVRCLDTLLPDFLNYSLNSNLGKKYCWAVKTDGVSQSNINAKKLIEYPICVPMIKEQKEIVKRVENLFMLADQIESKIENAQERVNLLIQSILAKAFRGEFTAKWREDNPDLISGENSAEALLKRIEEAKKAAKKKK